VEEPGKDVTMGDELETAGVRKAARGVANGGGVRTVGSGVVTEITE